VTAVAAREAVPVAAVRKGCWLQMTSTTPRHKRAELAGSTGAGVLGAGVGVLLAQWAAPYALLLILVGILLHGWGMLEKHRLEAGAGIPLWSKTLYWLCWIVLAVLVIWIGLTVFRG
jgi:hypothetical protein